MVEGTRVRSKPKERWTDALFFFFEARCVFDEATGVIFDGV